MSETRSAKPVVLLLPDGTGVRNFLLGRFLELAADCLSLTVVSTVPDEWRASYVGDSAVAWEEHRTYADRPALYMTRTILNYAHMYSVDTWGMKCVRERAFTGRGARRVGAEAARWLGRQVARARGVRWLDRRMHALVAREPETRHYRELFERIRPASVVSSTHRHSGVLPAVLAARSLGIPTATCIFSWDNLTSKARIVGPFDHYFTWGEQMTRELRQIYPEIPAHAIHQIGAIQFDPHVDVARQWSRERLCATIGADPARPLICFSSGDAGNSPEDPEHAGLIADLIKQGQITGNPQVVVRPTPAGGFERFDAIRRRHPEMIWAQPLWRRAGRDNWTQWLPQPDDVSLLANLARHADVNVSVASTMTLDFAIHGRPIVNIAFDMTTPGPFARPLWDYYYQFEHYRPVVETGAAYFSRTPKELAAHINTAIAHPGEQAANRRRLLDVQLAVPVGQAARALVDTIDAVSLDHRVKVPAQARAAAALEQLQPIEQ